jgi:predicted GNAT superfamily acetyltransferase
MQEGLKGEYATEIPRGLATDRFLALFIGLMSRIVSVKQDCQKAEADNEMLQMYIDSVTKSLAAKS